VGDFIKEVYHPEWLTNPVLVVKKNNNKWRICVDYTDLNKHCPKDPFALPRIDQFISSTASYVLLSFLGCYSGYHQIALKEEDHIKTAFINPLWSIRIHYNIIEAYMDDVVIKTRSRDEFITDPEETFNSLQQF
jgi:hypothetical protein